MPSRGGFVEYFSGMFAEDVCLKEPPLRRTYAAVIESLAWDLDLWAAELRHCQTHIAMIPTASWNTRPWFQSEICWAKWENINNADSTRSGYNSFWQLEPQKGGLVFYPLGNLDRQQKMPYIVWAALVLETATVVDHFPTAFPLWLRSNERLGRRPRPVLRLSAAKAMQREDGWRMPFEKDQLWLLAKQCHKPSPTSP